MQKRINTIKEIKEQSMEKEMIYETIKNVAINFLKDVLSTSLKISIEMIDDDSILEEFGFDSMDAINITKKMEKVFGVLPKTLFYEYGTLEELADYFVKKHESRLIDMYEKSILTKEKEIKQEQTDEKQEESMDDLPVNMQNEKGKYEDEKNVGFSEKNAESLDIAIIGMSGRFPMAKNIDEFWNNLINGKDCVTEIPKERWNPDLYYDPNKNSKGKYYTKQGGFISGVYEFDPLFFSITPNDAKMIDPQERLFLENVYETMQDAGYVRNGFKNGNGSTLGTNVGVYVGVMSLDYPLFGAQEQLLGNSVVTTGSLSSIANRVSYIFDFRGPSMAVDTMCSSSLYALHLACQSIQTGEIDAAVVGGINLSLHPNKYLLLCEHKFASARGKCESFGDKGEGYIPGEGVASILLKPLSKALKNNDHIYGVIKGTAINHGGTSHGGYLVPNPERQADVIEKSLKNAQINPRTISYVEAHGTGTSLGDPIEIAGLQKVYEKYTQENQFCKIGSVKSNIGHLEGAAGIAGLIKVLLQMEHKQIVPSIHSENLNPYIDFEHSPFTVSRDNSAWDRPLIKEKDSYVEYPRRAAISAFGAGGANAHVIVEEFINEEDELYSYGQHDYAIVLSAKSKEQLKESARRLLKKMEADELLNSDLSSIAYTLQTGRELFEFRLGIHIKSMDQLVQKLKAFLEGSEEGLFIGHVKKNSKVQKTVEYEKSLQDYFAKKDLNKLLSIWIKSTKFDWETLYSGDTPKKISLPTYPFLHEKYFGMNKVIPYLTEKKSILIEDAVMQHNEENEEQYDSRQEIEILQGKESNNLFLFEEVWENAVDDVELCGKRIAICFVKDSESIANMQMEIDICQGEIIPIWVTCGGQYEKKSNTNYTIAYNAPEDYVTCLTEILKDFNNVDAILYMNPLADKLFITDIKGIFYLIQAMKKANYTTTRLILAGIFRDSLERAYVESWIGFERSLSFNNNIKVVLLEQKNFSKADNVYLLLKEMYSLKSGSVLYEGGIRKEPVIHPVFLKTSHNTVIKKGGTYLITGGMGGLGFLLANWLGRKYNAKLILIGRSHKESVHEKLMFLQQKGINASYISGDISKINEATTIIEKAKSIYGTIHGIFHAAGIESGTSIFDKDIEEYENVLEPKTKGSIVLEHALKGDSLDFICYFSSTAAIVGDFGFSDYSVANRFLMGYCQHQNEIKSPFKKSIVVCWPLWRDGGMKFSNEQASKLYLKTSGQAYLEKDEGFELLDKILNQNSHQFIVMAGIKEKIYRMLHVQERTENSSSFYKKGKEWKSHMKGWSLEQSILWDLKELMQECIGVNFNQMDDNLNFADYGFDSVSLSEYAEMISSKFAISFSPNLFYNYATLKDLTGFIISNFDEQIRIIYDKDSVKDIERISESQESKSLEENKTQDQKTIDLEIEQKDYYKDAIAIVGISGKFPDADNPEELWDILVNGKEVIHTMPKERKEWDESITKESLLGSIRNIDDFDHEFFEISPREAANMDPRHRLLLEESWKALEDAGFGSESATEEKVGVFIGAEDGDYQSIVGNESGLTSNHNAIMAARISYFLNLTGPNMTINTACSSGLVAVHEACQSLRLNECTTALAAGINLFTTPVSYISMKKAGMLSPEGKCYAFDQRANGMVPAEAVAVVVLKKLSSAQKDRNNIYGIVCGSGINYDGRTNGITAPSGHAQTMLLKDVYRRYNIQPNQIGYIVAHGTGTKIGDPIEITSLLEAFKESGAKQSSIAITSNKPNIGHTLAASGVVGLITLLLAMKHDMIPASINCDKLSDYIDWSNSPFYVNVENQIWKESKDNHRVGAINSFGMSGTNAHIVVESYPSENRKEKTENSNYLFVLSAKTEEGLNKKCEDFIEFLEKDGKDISLDDISYTLIRGRQHFAYRIAIVASDRESTIAIINQALKHDKVPNVYRGVIARNHVSQSTIQKMVDELCYNSMIVTNTFDSVKKNLCAIAEFYCIGYHISSKDMFWNKDIRIVQIPNYPFQKNKFWISKKPEQMQLKKQSKDMSFELIVSKLIDTLSKILYVDKNAINCDKSFMELGLDSILGVEWIRNLNKEYGLNISSTKIYQYSNIIEFAKYVQELKKHHNMAADRQDVTAVINPESKDVEHKSQELIELTDNFDIISKPQTSMGMISLIQNDEKPMLEDDSHNRYSFEALAKTLAELLESVLYVEKGTVNYDRSFTELGLDSILAVEWINKINQIYHKKISSTKIYQYPTIEEFAKYLQTLLYETVSKENDKAESNLNEVLRQVYEGEIDADSASELVVNKLGE